MPSDMSAVFDNLYLGGLEAAIRSETLREHGITHILTIDDRPLTQDSTNGFTSKYVHGLDLQDTDLLSYFDECVEFINEGRKAGGVLVHCFAGMSRSATMVIAYMMAKCDTSLEDAHAYVKKMRSLIRPNVGFMEQLQLYEDMGGCIDRQHNGFRVYKLNLLALRVQAGVYSGDIPTEMYCEEAPHPDDIIYKCKKCRMSLFRSSALLSHNVGEGEAAFDWRGKSTTHKGSVVKSEDVCDKSLFIEPVRWMDGMLVNMEGKLSCPKCSAKIGSFKWYGERCPCGAWVAPAFHIQTAKVDESRPRAALVKIVQPRPVNKLPVMQEPGPMERLHITDEAPS